MPPTPPSEFILSIPAAAMPLRGYSTAPPQCPLGLKISQNRSDSSAPADTTLVPSGDFAMCSTRAVWLLNSRIFVKVFILLDGFHKQSWLSENPWDDTSSLWGSDHCMAHTWEPVSMVHRLVPSVEFQSRILLSAVPPPDASTSRCQGHQASALTAAWCCVIWNRGVLDDWLRTRAREPPRLLPPVEELRPEDELMAASQIQSKFSLPPDASADPSGLQARPHTSCWWPR
mmetsp:Transcript_9666/g.16023  ORF Transcript_9666/g.16023 Transcript_9666/m.16023 type:complete len:230 (+) Transcript_9666:121-810(+)